MNQVVRCLNLADPWKRDKLNQILGRSLYSDTTFYTWDTLHLTVRARVRVTLRLAVYRQSVRLGDKLQPNFIFQLNTCGYSPYVISLWREDGSVVYDCCWPTPPQSFSGPSPAGLMTTFYCLRFEIPTTWRARSPYLYLPRTGWPSYTHRNWVFFPSPPTTRRAAMEVFETASTRDGRNNAAQSRVQNWYR
jgi:hypothetical protein